MWARQWINKRTKLPTDAKHSLRTNKVFSVLCMEKMSAHRHVNLVSIFIFLSLLKIRLLGLIKIY